MQHEAKPDRGAAAILALIDDRRQSRDPVAREHARARPPARREAHRISDHQGFGRWLSDNGIELQKDERAALIGLAQHETRARKFFERNPDRWSYQTVWRELLPELDHESVDCIVTSPPLLGSGRGRRDPRRLGQGLTVEQYIDNLVAPFQQYRRVLRPTGTLLVNIGVALCRRAVNPPEFQTRRMRSRNALTSRCATKSSGGNPTHSPGRSIGLRAGP